MRMLHHDMSRSSPELAALIERQPSTDREDLTEPYGDLPGPESLIASTANPNDKEGVGGLLDVGIDLN